VTLAVYRGGHFAQIGGIRADRGEGWLKIFRAHSRAAALPVAIVRAEQG